MTIVLQSSNFLNSSTSCRRGLIRANINIPNNQTFKISLPRLQRRARLAHEQELISVFSTSGSPIEKQISPTRRSDPLVIEKLYAIKEAIVDRVEMHRNIGEQRSQWNSMLLTSINGITLAAATMVGIAASSSGDSVLGLKMSSAMMYLAATGMLVAINQIQPSQLAEEQRNAARLFQALYNQIETTLSIGHPSSIDVKEAMDRVLSLDKAYPLPLLGVMLEKFPSSVEPAVWWPQQRRRQPKRVNDNWNGWNGKLEEEMKEIMGVLGRKDQEEYISLGKKALKLNKFLAMSGPLLTGLAAIGSAFADHSPHGSWAAMLGIVGGALASVVNTVEHGGQVGMVFEMYRSNAGFFQYMQESIESNLTETDMERRENGEVFELKLALKLGRSLSDLRNLAAASLSKGEEINEFGSKLF
ncbi:hypothetical protein R3W88_005949 [Solanum pinnatisectum]|uniref:F-box protein n=1 Tax=Solanum pinnatisectum TaxID=50273 RepID=A0AAV9KDQ6_9SOLN|nr:hypothetical protein R3W88_005949 [Solanum pinnatisectum]